MSSANRHEFDALSLVIRLRIRQRVEALTLTPIVFQKLRSVSLTLPFTAFFYVIHCQRPF